MVRRPAQVAQKNEPFQNTHDSRNSLGYYVARVSLVNKVGRSMADASFVIEAGPFVTRRSLVTKCIMPWTNGLFATRDSH
jgi:hypothetical protein